MPAAAKLALQVRDAGPTTLARLASHARGAAAPRPARPRSRSSQAPVAARLAPGRGRRGDLRAAAGRRDRSRAGAPAARPRSSPRPRPRSSASIRSSPTRKFLDRAPAEVVEEQRAAARRGRADPPEARGGAGADRVLARRRPMLPCFVAAGEAAARPVAVVPAARYRDWLAAQPAPAARLARGTRLRAQAREQRAAAGADGAPRGRPADPERAGRALGLRERCARACRPATGASTRPGRPRARARRRSAGRSPATASSAIASATAKPRPPGARGRARSCARPRPRPRRSGSRAT